MSSKSKAALTLIKSAHKVIGRFFTLKGFKDKISVTHLLSEGNMLIFTAIATAADLDDADPCRKHAEEAVHLLDNLGLDCDIIKDRGYFRIWISTTQAGFAEAMANIANLPEMHADLNGIVEQVIPYFVPVGAAGKAMNAEQAEATLAILEKAAARFREKFGLPTKMADRYARKGAGKPSVPPLP